MCTNPLFVYRDIQFLINAGVDMFHFDIMDGIFVNNLCLDIELIKEMRKITFKEFDAHLMVLNPSKYIKILADAGIDRVSFHIECADDIENVINLAKNSNMKVGLAINPETPIRSLIKYLDKIDHILFLAVNPGFTGQSFQAHVIEKVGYLKSIVKEKEKSILFMADGAINSENLKLFYKNGVNVFIGGTRGLFNENGFISNVMKLKESVLKEI